VRVVKLQMKCMDAVRDNVQRGQSCHNFAAEDATERLNHGCDGAVHQKLEAGSLGRTARRFWADRITAGSIHDRVPQRHIEFDDIHIDHPY
jgi:hypothetical protein